MRFCYANMWLLCPYMWLPPLTFQYVDTTCQCPKMWLLRPKIWLPPPNVWLPHTNMWLSYPKIWLPCHDRLLHNETYERQLTSSSSFFTSLLCNSDLPLTAPPNLGLVQNISVFVLNYLLDSCSVPQCAFIKGIYFSTLDFVGTWFNLLGLSCDSASEQQFSLSFLSDSVFTGSPQDVLAGNHGDA